MCPIKFPIKFTLSIFRMLKIVKMTLFCIIYIHGMTLVYHIVSRAPQYLHQFFETYLTRMECDDID